MATSNTHDCFREVIGLRVQGLLFGALPVNRPDLARGNKTIIFDDGTGLTIASNGSYWRETREDIERATRLKRKELAALTMETKDVLALADALAHNDGLAPAETMELLPSSDVAADDGAMTESCIEVGTSLRAEDEPCLDPERCRRMDYCLRDPSDERYPAARQADPLDGPEDA